MEIDQKAEIDGCLGRIHRFDWIGKMKTEKIRHLLQSHEGSKSVETGPLTQGLEADRKQ